MLSERINTDRKAAQERFESIFETSPDAILFSNLKTVTGINNRRFFIEEVQNILSNKSISDYEYAFIMIDIDYFKKINDTFRHAMGDIVNKAVADNCKNTLRVKGYLVVLEEKNLQYC